MTDLQAIFAALDELSPKDKLKVKAYLEEQTSQAIYAYPPERVRTMIETFRPVQEEALKMTDEEIDEAIREAVEEVRRERKAKSRESSS